MDLHASGFRPGPSPGQQRQQQGQKGKKGQTKGGHGNPQNLSDRLEGLQICTDQSGIRVVRGQGQEGQRSDQINWRQSMGQYAGTPHMKGQGKKGQQQGHALVQGQQQGGGRGQGHQQGAMKGQGQTPKYERSQSGEGQNQVRRSKRRQVGLLHFLMFSH